MFYFLSVAAKEWKGKKKKKPTKLFYFNWNYGIDTLRKWLVMDFSLSQPVLKYMHKKLGQLALSLAHIQAHMYKI